MCVFLLPLNLYEFRYFITVLYGYTVQKNLQHKKKKDRRSVLVIKLVFIVLRKTCFHTTPVFCLLYCSISLTTDTTDELYVHVYVLNPKYKNDANKKSPYPYPNSLYFSPFFYIYFYTLFSMACMSNPTNILHQIHTINM